MITKNTSNKSVTLVTTHLNADFDGLASSVAAARLYGDETVVVLPGSQEKAVRKYLKALKVKGSPLLDMFSSVKELDLSRLRRLVVVDTNQRERLGPLQELLEKKDLKVIIYDHHKKDDCDIRFNRYITAEVGANTTLLLRRLRKRGIKPSRQELDLFLLGIYEDTGSFTFTSTTAEDLRQAAWLIEKGGSLSQVTKFLGGRFTPEHISALNDLLESAQTLNFANIPVTIARSSSSMYLDDYAVLVHELMDMARLPVLFALAMMDDHVIVVGRSRDKRVDVGDILQELGGGGHPFAASASLKGVTLSEAENRLVSALSTHLGKGLKVADIMSSPVMWAEPEAPIYEVHDLIAKYGFSIIPVAKKGRIKGFVTRNIVEKAIYHGLGAQPVSEYMSTEFKVFSPKDDLSRVQQAIVEGHQRFIPVVGDDGTLTGIITRTDLLEILSSDPTKRPEALIPPRASRRNIRKIMEMQLPVKALRFLKEAGKTADELGMNVYVVGGFVRDLLLKRPNFDIDLVVEGDGIRFAKRLAEKFSARTRTHKKFETAVIIFPDGSKIDVATARWEYYEYPAAMPTVALSSIKLDLFRRDFTINTLAIKLNSKDFGVLIDFFGGQRDLKDGIIRVLHSLSFIDDPTRILRAVRFEQRFGFKIGKHTLRLIKNSLKLGILDRLSSKRLFTELRLILEEPDPRPCLLRLDSLKVLEAIHPSLSLAEREKKLLDSVYDVLTWYELLYLSRKVRRWQVYLMALVTNMGFNERQEVVRRLGITGKVQREIVAAPEKAKRLMEEMEAVSRLKDSKIVELLEGQETEFLLYLMALSRKPVRQAISRYITDLSRIKPQITGTDLKRLGFTPGPIYRKIFDAVKKAKLDGLLNAKEEEIDYVKKNFGENSQ